jgi:pyruvate dehydrogenase E1 component alpha subunit
MNLSALWKLPVMFVCVNNEYGMGTRLDHASASLEFEKRAETFGLLAAEVDGIDVFEVYNQSKNLLEDVRKGKPAFLKVNSYRFHGHARMDKSPYRDQQEEEEGRKKRRDCFSQRSHHQVWLVSGNRMRRDCGGSQTRNG